MAYHGYWWSKNYIVGDHGSNDLIGTAGRDWIIARGGDDHIASGGGNDRIFAGRGDDIIDAGDGNDWVFAGRGDDYIIASAGHDVIFGGRGTDTLELSGSIEDYSIHHGGCWWQQSTRIRDNEGNSQKLFSVEILYFAEDDLTIYIDGRNNAVQARDDVFATSENLALSFDIAALLDNDFDYDGDTLTLSAIDNVSSAGATISLAGSEITYNPGLNFDALAVGETTTDTFSYSVEDGRGGLSTATVTITITGENDAPELDLPEVVAINEGDTLVEADFTASDIDGDSLTFSISGGDDASLFSIDALTGDVSFISAPDFETPLDADGDNFYEVEISADDGNGGVASDSMRVAVLDLREIPDAPVRLNEIHYDNAGADIAEFIEIRAETGLNIRSFSLEFYDGASGALYGDAVLLRALPVSSDGVYDYYVIDAAGLADDIGGVALVNGVEVIDAIAYEGSFTASDGTASGVDFEDIGVAQDPNTALGQSLQRQEDGSWAGPIDDTRGVANTELAPLTMADAFVF